MTGGSRLAAGVAAVALIVTALGVAAPTSANVDAKSGATYSVNR